MNSREKKLLMVLFGAAFLIVNLFLFTSYRAVKDKKEAALANGKKEIHQMLKDLDEAADKQDEMDWLRNHEPVEGIHSQVRSELVSDVQKSAGRYHVILKKAPQPLAEDTEQGGAYRSALVKVLANATDRELYLWIADLQDPNKGRSIVRLKISPQRDDKTRVDCELELAQWFTPKPDEAPVTP